MRGTTLNIRYPEAWIQCRKINKIGWIQVADSGAQPGNQNAAKGKAWRDAINRALAKRSGVDKVKALDELAEKFLAKCDEGDMQALKELGDRLDGKPTQTLQGPEGESLFGPLVADREALRSKIRG